MLAFEATTATLLLFCVGGSTHSQTFRYLLCTQSSGLNPELSSGLRFWKEDGRNNQTRRTNNCLMSHFHTWTPALLQRANSIFHTKLLNRPVIWLILNSVLMQRLQSGRPPAEKMAELAFVPSKPGLSALGFACRDRAGICLNTGDTEWKSNKISLCDSRLHERARVCVCV